MTGDLISRKKLLNVLQNLARQEIKGDKMSDTGFGITLAAQMVAQAEAEPEQKQKELKWIKADEAFPEEEQRVFVITKSSYKEKGKQYWFYTGYRFKGTNGLWHNGYGKVIYWLPIPEIPEEELQKKES